MRAVRTLIPMMLLTMSFGAVQADWKSDLKAAAKQQEHSPRHVTGRLPVHDELAATEVDRNHEQQQRPAHGNRRVADERQRARDERLHDRHRAVERARVALGPPATR